MGIVNLRHVNPILAKRKEQSLVFNGLSKGLSAKTQELIPEKEYNNAYFPIVFETEEIALKMKSNLEKSEIFPRRYLYPSLSSLEYSSKGNMTISDSISSRILCLPLYHELSKEEQELISRILHRTQNN